LPSHIIKSWVSKLKTRVGKVKKNLALLCRIFSKKNVCPPWLETMPAPLELGVSISFVICVFICYISVLLV